VVARIIDLQLDSLFLSTMLDYILAHPLYLPFILLNIFIVYKVIKIFVIDDKGNDNKDNDNDGDVPDDNDPVLDLPPGVAPPVEELDVNK